MQSGKTAVFLIVNVRLCEDPRDMFFCDIEGLGYLGELDWPDPVQQPTGTIMDDLV